jgi:hypothetical protein
MPTEKIDPTSLTPETLAKLLSVSAKRLITPEQVTEIAEDGNLLSTDGKINLIPFTAFLIQETTNGE